MADRTDVTVKGARQLVSACNEIQRNFARDFKKAAEDVARQVVSDAKRGARTRQGSRAAASLVASVSGQYGTVSASSPFFAGAEFGGQGRPTTQQFPPYRGKRGYFLYPSMRANAARLNKMWDAALMESMEPWDYRPW